MTDTTVKAASRAMRKLNGHPLKAHLLELERRNLSDGTITRRRQAIERFAEHLHPRHVLDATADDVQRFLDARDIGPRTRYHWLSNLHCFYEWATAEGLTDTDPTLRITRPKLPRLLPRPIGEGELEAAITAAPSLMRSWLLLAGYAGLRCAEIARLDVTDVLLSEHLLLVRGKGGRERLVPMHPRVEEDLRGRLVRSGPLFRRPRGSRYPAAMVSREIAVYLDDLGITATAHSLRHRFGTRTYAACGDLRVVQELLGHANVATSTIYTAWSPGRAREAVLALGSHDVSAVG